MNHFIEICSLHIKPGTRNEFHRLYIEEALPRLKRWNFDVVEHGPSLHDENTYYVIRHYGSLARQGEMEDTYYASDDWRKGPREAMLALIENYIDVVLELDNVTVQSLGENGNHIVEIRSYELKPMSRDEFHRLFLEEAFPLLKHWNVDVVAYGPSLHDENSYYLMRGYDSLADREQSEDAFYSSDEWRQKVHVKQSWF